MKIWFIVKKELDKFMEMYGKLQTVIEGSNNCVLVIIY